MAETKKDKQLFSIGRIFFLLIVIPLSLMAFLIANGIFKVGDTARERATTVLDQKSQEEIKIRAINTAEEVANFLRERENDISSPPSSRVRRPPTSPLLIRRNEISG